MDGLPDQTEAELHEQVIDWLRVALPRDALVHHSPNEGKRGFRAQADLKKTGVQAGMPDLMICWRGDTYFLELKTRTGKVSAAQADVAQQLMDTGFKVAVLRNLPAVDACLRDWGLPLRTVPFAGRCRGGAA